MDFEIAVRLNIYDTIVETTKAPTVAEVAKVLGSSLEEVREAFNKLCEKRLLVLEAGSDKIRMAPPFAGVETPFRVDVGEKSYFANCVWDALGVVAALRDDGEVATTCGDCGEALCHPLCSPSSALVGRHCLHLTNHASLPVGRARK